MEMPVIAAFNARLSATFVVMSAIFLQVSVRSYLQFPLDHEITPRKTIPPGFSNTSSPHPRGLTGRIDKSARTHLLTPLAIGSHVQGQRSYLLGAPPGT